VFYTTSDQKLSQYVKFPGIYIDFRKRDMIPSRLLRAKQKIPQLS